ncbi:MAG: 16S rRNA (cytidine(1402)-2'-O)-methyltransferase [Aggregatilineales bacterium]
MGTLYIVPTPIGNLEDITLRALRILKQVRLIAAEDTRTTSVLLRHYEILTPLTSYHEHNKIGKLESIFDALANGDVALVSDAGMPGISDPGYELIRAALTQGIRVEPLPGANAVLPALVGSGLPTDSFIFAGFIPKKYLARQQFFEAYQDETRTVIFYESPHRLVDSLTAIAEVLGERDICVARELTKLYEEFTRGNVSDVLAHYQETPPRGEIAIVLGGKPTDADETWDENRVRLALEALLDEGESLSRAAKRIATQSGWNKRDVYALGNS